MASATRRLLLQSRRTTPTPTHARQWQRALSTTPALHARGERDDPPPEAAPPRKPALEATWASTPDKTAAQLRTLVEELKALDMDAVDDAERKGQKGIPYSRDWSFSEESHFDLVRPDRRQIKSGFWAEGDPSMGADEDFWGDDITSLGHGELRKHRQLREYARMVAWELPLLNGLAQPFTPPTAATPFRFRYTSYLGETHPATNKVVVEFSPADLSLTEQQRAKLIKLAGPRYNPSTDLIKLSTEQFDTQTQNKRFLGETIQTLIAEAKDPTDLFEDVPFDFRHHKPKVRHEFPKEWVLTPERKAYLAQKRAEAARLQDIRKGNGELIDGRVLVETSLPFAVEEPVMVEAPRRK